MRLGYRGAKMVNKKKPNEVKIEDAHAEWGTGSVYADLGYKDHEEMETKSDPVIEIGKAMKKKNSLKRKLPKFWAFPSLNYRNF